MEFSTTRENVRRRQHDAGGESYAGRKTAPSSSRVGAVAAGVTGIIMVGYGVEEDCLSMTNDGISTFPTTTR